MNPYYPVQLFIFKWKTSTECQLGCRPDALSDLCAAILNLGPVSVRVSSVETQGDEIASFLCTVEVPTHLKSQYQEAIEPFRIKT